MTILLLLRGLVICLGFAASAPHPGKGLEQVSRGGKPQADYKPPEQEQNSHLGQIARLKEHIMAHHDIVYVNKEEEVVTVVAETEQEKEDIVAILERNNAL